MKATFAILAVSAVTAMTLLLQRRRRDKETKVLEGTFTRLHPQRREISA